MILGGAGFAGDCFGAKLVGMKTTTSFCHIPFLLKKNVLSG